MLIRQTARVRDCKLKIGMKDGVTVCRRKGNHGGRRIRADHRALGKAARDLRRDLPVSTANIENPLCALEVSKSRTSSAIAA